MPYKPTRKLRCISLLLAAAALAGCTHDGAPLSRTSAAAAGQGGPVEPITRQQASAHCWMKFERGRADLPLDTRMVLVDKCIDEVMKTQAR